MVDEVRNIHRQVLPNGLTVITEEMQHIRSVSIGIWIKTGSRDEDPAWNGISHFIEHMVFKGTKHRTAEDIARWDRVWPDDLEPLLNPSKWPAEAARRRMVT